MGKLATKTCTLALASLLAFPLAACAAQQNASSGAPSQAAASESAQLDEGVRDAIIAKVAEARDNGYDSVTFSMDTETTVAAKDDDGTMQQQVMTNKMSGELDKSSGKPVMHIKFETASNMRLEKTVYEMYIDDSGLAVVQGGNIFKNDLTEEERDSYAVAITSIGDEEELLQLLDVANSYTMEEQPNGDTAITIVADVDKLIENALIDTSSLPEGSSVATLVASYIVDADNHFKSVRIMSSTSGTPTYRVDQNYQFSNYNSTELPEWPDFKAYIAEQSGILTDDEGRMYITDEDGQTHYVDSIGDDGMIYFQN